jgi:hypothetical protein
MGLAFWGERLMGLYTYEWFSQIHGYDGSMGLGNGVF